MDTRELPICVEDLTSSFRVVSEVGASVAGALAEAIAKTLRATHLWEVTEEESAELVEAVLTAHAHANRRLYDLDTLALSAGLNSVLRLLLNSMTGSPDRACLAADRARARILVLELRASALRDRAMTLRELERQRAEGELPDVAGGCCGRMVC
jgi:type II secretory pathway component PulK